MKPELSQIELEKLVRQGKTSIWQYNTLYFINYSRNIGNGEFYIQQVARRQGRKIGVSGRGRFIAMEPSEANKYLTL